MMAQERLMVSDEKRSQSSVIADQGSEITVPSSAKTPIITRELVIQLLIDLAVLLLPTLAAVLVPQIAFA